MEVLKAKAWPEKPISACLGVHELFSREMWRATLTELIGTAALIFTITTSVVSSLESQKPDNPRLLLSLAIAISLFLFLLTTIPISGGHMNPIFSFIALLKRLISPTRAACYILAQCVGSILGFLAVRSVTNESYADKYSLGGCTVPADGVTPAFVLEFACTFVMLFVAVTVAFDPRRFEELGVTMVCGVIASTAGLMVFVSVTVTGNSGYGGVGLNPARCLGAVVLKGGLLWHGHWVFWVGPFLACLVYFAYSVSFDLGRNDEGGGDESEVATERNGRSDLSKYIGSKKSDSVETL